ncbi:MAG: T9SS type A sorting domain-containing protein [Lewinellaceae bacterium]|nr:T9SS type A sorting domain-containing protein [Saprospiraceae bacterium]MCB9344542.1 T9SS type A sorting domain-containing protein [Lewinellaceae bacterium]
MKNRILHFLLLLLCSMPGYKAFAVDFNPCIGPGCPPSGNFGQPPVFQRTFQPAKAFKHVVRKKQSPSQLGVVISKADFEAHMKVGNIRNYKYTDADSVLIMMDVKGVDPSGDNPQTWDMPNFNNFTHHEAVQQHVDPMASGFLDEYPTATHCVYAPELNHYEMYEMTDEDIFALGLITIDSIDQAELYDLFITASPLPLEWGLLFEGIVTVIYTQDPDVDSTVYTQLYDAVATGILNTYDDGPQDAVKLEFNSMVQEFKDGQVTYQKEYDQIVWYCKSGHYLRGTIAEGAPLEGPTTFNRLRYQKITGNSSATHSAQSVLPGRQFPNPVAAGETLTVQLPASLVSGRIEVVNMQGMMVADIDISNPTTDHMFEIQVPAQLPAGMYAYSLFNQKNERVTSGKVQVQ